MSAVCVCVCVCVCVWVRVCVYDTEHGTFMHHLPCLESCHCGAHQREQRLFPPWGLYQLQSEPGSLRKPKGKKKKTEKEEKGQSDVDATLSVHL